MLDLSNDPTPSREAEELVRACYHPVPTQEAEEQPQAYYPTQELEQQGAPPPHHVHPHTSSNSAPDRPRAHQYSPYAYPRRQNSNAPHRPDIHYTSCPSLSS